MSEITDTRTVQLEVFGRGVLSTERFFHLPKDDAAIRLINKSDDGDYSITFTVNHGPFESIEVEPGEIFSIGIHPGSRTLLRVMPKNGIDYIEALKVVQ